MIEDQAWEAYFDRDTAKAVSLFRQALEQDAQDPDVCFGLARALIQRGELEQAERAVAQFHEMGGDDGEGRLLRAELLSARTKRPQASQLLMMHLALEPGDALGLALLGEQRLRLGDWDDGVTYLSEALNGPDREGFAIHHVMTVSDALIKAVHEGRLPSPSAEKFFTRLAHTTGKQHARHWLEIQTALKSGRPLFETSGPTRPMNQKAVRLPEATGRAAVSQPTAQASRTQVNKPSRSSRVQRAQTRAAAAPELSVAPRVGAAPTTSAAPKMGTARIMQREASPFLASIQQERALNQQLRASLAPLPQEDWPSQRSSRIDDVVLETTPRVAPFICEEPFYVTEGSIFTELYLERARDAMLRELPDQEGLPLSASLRGVFQLEMNLREHLGMSLQVVSSDLELNQEIEVDPLAAAVGYFVGQTLCAEEEGVWSFEGDVEDALVHVQGEHVRPVAVAQQWIHQARAGRHDVLLCEPLIAVMSDHPGSYASRSRETFVDPTKELSGRALESALAGLWRLYRLSLLRTPVAQMAPDVEVKGESSRLILVDLGVEWCPPVGLSEDAIWEDKGRPLVRPTYGPVAAVVAARDVRARAVSDAAYVGRARRGRE